MEASVTEPRTTDRRVEPVVTEPRRIRQFAAFFKNYMSISSVVVAILPVPVTSLGVIPVFAPDKDTLGVITSLTCFLTLGFIFYCRHSIARILYVEGPVSAGGKSGRRGGVRRATRLLLTSLIFLLILLSVVLFFAHWAWATDLTRRAETFAEPVAEATVSGGGPALAADAAPPDGGSPVAAAAAAPGGEAPTAVAVAAADPYSWWRHDELGIRLVAMLLYTAFFVCAEAAFILMAIKEYLQDLLGLSEYDLIYGQRVSAMSVGPGTATASPTASG